MNREIARIFHMFPFEIRDIIVEGVLKLKNEDLENLSIEEIESIADEDGIFSFSEVENLVELKIRRQKIAKDFDFLLSTTVFSDEELKQPAHMIED